MANMVSLKLEHAIGGEQPQDAMQSIRMCTDGCRQFCRRSRPVAERIAVAADRTNGMSFSLADGR